MAKTTAAEFQRRIGFYQDEADKAPVIISRNGRDRLVLLSIEAYQALQDYQASLKSHPTTQRTRRRRT